MGWPELLADWGNRKRSVRFKITAVSLGTVFFMIILPILLILVGRLVIGPFELVLARWLELTLAVVILAWGLFWLYWAVGTQWFVGRGTPVPLAAPEKLIVSGPYRIIRNPIQFGMVFCYFGLGILFGGLLLGLFCFAAGMLIGSPYHKYVEEKELVLRFGDDYLRYRERTPFVIPRLGRGKKPKMTGWISAGPDPGYRPSRRAVAGPGKHPGRGPGRGKGRRRRLGIRRSPPARMANRSSSTTNSWTALQTRRAGRNWLRGIRGGFLTSPWNELRSLDFGSWFLRDDPFGQLASGNVPSAEAEALAGEVVPTLQEALDFSAREGLLVNVEIKNLGGGRGR